MCREPPPTHPPDLESTAVLLDRARGGDPEARERLARRYLPHLRQFARGRLPSGARSLEETDDIVDIAMMRGFDRLDTFQAERRGSFLVYLRVVVDNLIRDRWRCVARRPVAFELPEDMPDPGRSPLDEVVAKEKRERYEHALLKLRPSQREVIILRFELDLSCEEIAEEMRLASADAARMRVERALIRLAKALKEHRDGHGSRG